MKRHNAILATSAAAAMLVGLAPASSATPPDPVAPDPVAFELQVPAGVKASPDLQVILDAWPSQEYESKLEVGDELTSFRIVPEVSSSDGTTISVHIPADSLPADAINSEGLVHFDVTVLDSGGKSDWVGTTSLSVQELDLHGQSAWADPLYIPEHPDGPTTLSASRPQVASAVLTSVASNSKLNNVLSTSSDTDTAVPLSVCPPSKKTLKQSSRRWATVGTTYPLKGSDSGTKARMQYSKTATHKTTFGIAASNGGWSSSGTKTVSGSWGHDWNYSKQYRAYRVEVMYGKYYNSGWACGAGRSTWEPRYETGGVTHVNLSSRPSPTYKNCSIVSAGTWTRGLSDGHSYKHSTGVKFKSVIGVDLSVEGQFNSAKTYQYSIVGNKQKLCGKQTYPSKAGNIALYRR
ncbi:hypothetical protein [Isoptericola croceus]|uniref:hypothetical protein n=1 Tax=Isoptericola croceus TaxID=3031406 RepID=UPI0023F6652B|nr:hypothetical protein [Isoptericola croceus]